MPALGLRGIALASSCHQENMTVVGPAGMLRKCNVNNGGCAHFCIDVTGGMTCTCAAGYQLGQDGATCEPKGALLPSFPSCFVSAGGDEVKDPD